MLKGWCEVSVPQLKFKRKSCVSAFFYNIMLFPVAESILCHLGLDSCKVLAKARERIVMVEKRQSYHPLCPWAIGQGVTNNFLKVGRPQCLKRQIIEQWREGSRCPMENSIMHDRGSCISEVAMAQHANGAVLLPVGSCEPTSSCTAIHQYPAQCHAAYWERTL